MDTQALWMTVLDGIRPELSEATFKTWFEHADPVGFSDGEAFGVAVQSEFSRAWFESHYKPLIARHLALALGHPAPVTIVVIPREKEALPEAIADEAPFDESGLVTDSPEGERSPASFDSLQTFETFVVGSSNEFAYHAALAVAEKPGLGEYNPLLIHGGSGLGKTHLLMAIAHYVEEHYPHKKVRYVTTETFTNDFIYAIGDRKRIAGFHKQYRAVDVLLVDDIQFLERKEETQREFFHTFNTLRLAGKQIVLTSDRPPKDIGKIEERLRSRFGEGLITDIHPAQLETRLAILHRRAQADAITDGVRVSDEVINLIAERASSNIRELVGAFVHMKAYITFKKMDSVSLEQAERILDVILPETTRRPIPISLIQREVCHFFNISHTELIGDKRAQKIVYPRQVAMYLARELTDLSLPKIGASFGGRDHTTVMHAYAKIEKLIAAQRDVFNEIQHLIGDIRKKA